MAARGTIDEAILNQTGGPKPPGPDLGTRTTEEYIAYLMGLPRHRTAVDPVRVQGDRWAYMTLCGLEVGGSEPLGVTDVIAEVTCLACKRKRVKV
jgi:hypothetical protein